MKTDDPGPSSDSNVERLINVLGQAGVMVIYSLSTCQKMHSILLQISFLLQSVGIYIIYDH